MQTIYGLIKDRGDGGSGLHWYRNKDTVDELLDSDNEDYYANEGSPAVTLNLPDDLDLAAAGFRMRD